MTSRRLGFLFLAPAMIFVVLFFLAPVVLTAVFSFTNMSTATGITGGAWQISPSTLQTLASREGLPDLAERLGKRVFVVDEAGLEALAAEGADPALVAELGEKLLGKPFDDRRAFEREIKKLKNRPRRVREIKKLSAHFERSVVGQRFDSAEALVAAVRGVGLTLAPQEAEALSRAAYTGWTWTTENFRRMVAIPDTRRTLINTLFYVFSTLILFNTGFAMVLAIATHYLPERSAGVFRTIWLLPRVLPPVLYVLMWKWLAWDTGFLSALLDDFGIRPRNWMLDTAANAWVFVILINGFVGASMGMLIFSAAIKAIPEQIFYASEVDGASRWQQIRHIILPQLRWPILFITTYQTLSLLASFEYILLATEGGPAGATEVWSLKAYLTALNNYAGNLAYGYGAALALVLVVIGITLSVAYLFFFDFRSQTRPPRIEI